MPLYRVCSAVIRPDLIGRWDGHKWQEADTAEPSHFRTEGSSHRPKTSVRLFYDSLSCQAG